MQETVDNPDLEIRGERSVEKKILCKTIDGVEVEVKLVYSTRRWKVVAAYPARDRRGGEDDDNS